MTAKERTIEAFIDALGSGAPTPGGGGASALTAAVGAALMRMVGALTVGKPRYAAVEDDIQRLNARAQTLRAELLALIDADAEAFAPLAAAYRLPKETAEARARKAEVMETALRQAAEPPLRMMERCCEAIELCEEYAAKGATLAVSDAGTAAALCKAALEGAGLNVSVNTALMRDRAYADELDRQARGMLEGYAPRADAVYRAVRARLEYPQEGGAK